jgi:pSer/pThr/pTyr-binding forkhead associated (FHA) protein
MAELHEPTPRLESPILRIFEGSRRGIEIIVNGDEVLLGRTGTSPLQLDKHADVLVSSQHARLYRHDSGWMLEDLRSKNGTYRNGLPLTAPTLVEPDDDVTLGRPNVQGSVSFSIVFLSRRLQLAIK